MAFVLFHHRLAWVSIAPFGRPVVPEVYMMSATSSGWTGSAPRGRRVRRSAPSAVGSVAEVRADRELRAIRVDHRPVRVVGDERVDAGVTDDEGELGPGEPEVERHEDRADPRCGEHRFEKARLVEPEEGDPVALREPKPESRQAQSSVARCISR